MRVFGDFLRVEKVTPRSVRQRNTAKRFTQNASTPRSVRQLNIAYGSRPVKALEELIVCAAVYFLQFNNNACTDI